MTSMRLAVALAALAVACGDGPATVEPDANAPGLDGPIPDAGPPGRIKVVTWNLKHGDSGAAAQADFLAALDPDVVLTQETPEAVATAIQTQLGGAWKVRHFAGSASEGNAIFTRLDTPAGVVDGEIVGDDHLIGASTWGGNRYVTRVTVRVGATDVSVFATHLDYPAPGATWDTHADNRNQLVAWLDTFAGLKLWGGDFNAKTDGNSIQIETIAAMDERGIDSCRGFFEQTHAWCNTNYPTKDGPTRFDYIYKAGGMMFRSHEVVPSNNLSDHDAVVSIVEVP